MKTILYDLDILQWSDVPFQSYGNLLMSTGQIKPIGIITKDGKKYLKYRFVNWK